MKKFFLYSRLPFAIIAMVIIFSCEKQQEQFNSQTNNSNYEPNVNFNVTVKNNILVFKTISDYEAVVNNPSEETKDKFLKKVSSFKNFSSLASFNSNESQLKSNYNGWDTLITDEYFKSILNTEFSHVKIFNCIS